MKRILAIIAAAMLLAVPGLALAFGAQAGSDVTLPKGDTKAGTFYAAGNVVTIDGDVDGDLICAGNTVTVNGAVHGDVICAAQTISVNGPVDGSVRLVGQSLNITGTVGRNVTVAGQSVTIGSSAKVSGDMGVAGQTVSVNGPVDKDLYGAMGTLSLGAAVGGVNARINDLAFGGGASVRGDLSYTSNNTFSVDKAKVGGNITRTAPPQVQRHESPVRGTLAFGLYWLVAALIVGLVMVGLAPKAVRAVTATMDKRPGASVGWGLVVLLLGPIVILLLLITVIGIPLAMLAGGLWLLILGVSQIFAGIAIGDWVMRRAEWKKGSLLWATVVGIPIAVILFNIPWLGALFALVAMFWAVGGLMLSYRTARG